jgi:uncharacterized protein (TIGR03437 family)
VNVYGGGFGPVEPVPPTGEPAPVQVLSRTSQQPLARTLSSATPLETPASAAILYSSLAPGWIGLYQLDVRPPEVPAPLNPERFPVLCCGIPNSTSAAGYLPFRPR